MWEAKFPTQLAFTGYSGVSMRLFQDEKEVAYVGAMTWSPQEQGIFAGAIVIYSLEESFDVLRPSEVEVLPDMDDRIGEVNMHGRLFVTGLHFFEGLRVNEACHFTAQAIVTEEYHQIPLEEEGQ